MLISKVCWLSCVFVHKRRIKSLVIPHLQLSLWNSYCNMILKPDFDISVSEVFFYERKFIILIFRISCQMTVVQIKIVSASSNYSGILFFHKTWIFEKVFKQEPFVLLSLLLQTWLILKMASTWIQLLESGIYCSVLACLCRCYPHSIWIR